MRTEGFVLIGRNGDDYYFCDSVFQHRDDFQGATGSIVRPVSPEEYEWCSDPENVAERLQDYHREYTKDWADPDCEECNGYPDDDGCDTCGVESLDDLTARAIAIDGVDHLMFDGSYGCAASAVFDALGVEHESTDCSGCGRIFARYNGGPFDGYDEVYNQAALDAIRALEDGKISYASAAKVIFGN